MFAPGSRPRSSRLALTRPACNHQPGVKNVIAQCKCNSPRGNPHECNDCGKLVGAKHALNCPDRDLTPVMPSELSLSERLQRKEDLFNDWNWDYHADVEKLAEVLT